DRDPTALPAELESEEGRGENAGGGLYRQDLRAVSGQRVADRPETCVDDRAKPNDSSPGAEQENDEGDRGGADGEVEIHGDSLPKTGGRTGGRCCAASARAAIRRGGSVQGRRASYDSVARFFRRGGSSSFGVVRRKRPIWTATRCGGWPGASC